MEAFYSRVGAVIIRGGTECGAVRGVTELSGQGSVGVEAIELRLAHNAQAVERGLILELAGWGQQKAEAYVDESEIDSLVRGLEYVANLRGTASKLATVSARYVTTGKLSITNFSDKNAFHTFVEVEGHKIYLKMEDLTKLKELIVKAAAELERARRAE